MLLHFVYLSCLFLIQPTNSSAPHYHATPLPTFQQIHPSHFSKNASPFLIGVEDLSDKEIEEKRQKEESFLFHYRHSQFNLKQKILFSCWLFHSAYHKSTHFYLLVQHLRC
jgi:hypothetical protein